MPCPFVPLKVSYRFLCSALRARKAGPARWSLVHCLRLGAGGVFARVYPNVDDGGTTRFVNGFARSLQCRTDLCRVAHFLTAPAQHFAELAERYVAQQIPDIATLLAVFGNLAIADLVHRGVIADHGD